MSLLLSDLARRLENVVGPAKIAEADHAGLRLRLSMFGRLTGWLPHPAVIAKNFVAWFPARVGTQVMAASPSGDQRNATISQTLYTSNLSPPETSGEVDVVRWNDGTEIRYDSAAQEMKIFSAGDIKIRAVGTIWLDAARIRVFEGG